MCSMIILGEVFTQCISEESDISIERSERRPQGVLVSGPLIHRDIPSPVFFRALSFTVGTSSCFPRKFLTSDTNVPQAGSASSSKWFLLSSVTRREFGMPAAISRPSSSGTDKSPREWIIRVGAFTLGRSMDTSTLPNSS